MKLAQAEFRPLIVALTDALLPGDLELVAGMLGTPLYDVVAPNATHQIAVLRVLNWAQKRDLVSELIVEAREINPTNAALRNLAARASVSVDVPGRLERAVEGDSSVALQSWQEGLGAIEPTICSVEGIPKAGGTGFLVAPDLVLTNQHVVQPLIDGKVVPEDVILRFDYKQDRDGATVRPGTVVRLNSKKPILDHSPHSAVDQAVGLDGLPGPEELDYAVLELDRKVGAEPIGQFDASPQRGWIRFPDTKPVFRDGMLAIILQHPRTRPITIAFDTVIGLNDPDGRTRVRYKVDTDNGSSGSPVFDIQWNLIALHHSGDPDFSRDAAYNEGIPIDTIHALLERRGHGVRLSAPI